MTGKRGLPSPQNVTPPYPLHPASHHLTVNNMHHSLDLAHICVDAAGRRRCVCVRACFKGPWTNGGATWSDQMFWFLMCIAHQKQQPVPLLGSCYPVMPANPSASCLPGPSALWVLAVSLVCLQFPTCFLSDSTSTSAETFLQGSVYVGAGQHSMPGSS